MYHREWYTILMRQVPHPDPAPHTCPRCLGGVPNEEMRGQYPGALSRTDNLTEVCSNCGTMEAIEQIGGTLYRQADWPLAGGPTRSLQDILSDPEDPDRAPAPSQRTGGRRSDDWEQFPHATNITETMDTINRRGEDRDPLGGGEIVHGDDGLDEITTTTSTKISHLNEKGIIRLFILNSLA